MPTTIQRKVLTGVAIASVLGAGAIATAVNASILESQPTTESAATDLIAPPVTASVTSPPPTAPAIEVIRVTAEPELADDTTDVTTTTAAATTTIPSVTPPPAEDPAPPTAPMTVTDFSIGAAGVASVKSDMVTVDDVTASAAAGWSVFSADHGADWGQVIFRSADTEVTFDVVLSNGQFVTNVTARGLQPPAPAPAPSTGGHEYDDDDEYDDDEYEDDEYEYEDHEDEDHEYEDHEDEDHEDEERDDD